MRIKNLIAYAALALGVIATPFAGRAATGDIYEIYPVEGSCMGPQDALMPPKTFTFAVRLLSRNFNVPNPKGWYLQWIGHGSEAYDAQYNPLRLGIVVSGRLEFADILDVKPCTGENMAAYTDVICTYKVKPGDLALPVRLALAGSTKDNPIIAGTSDTDTAYCLQNADRWVIRDDDGNVSTFTYCTEERAADVGTKFPTGTDRRVDYDLSTYGRFYVQGIRFAEPWDTETAWRSVKAGTTQTSNATKIETIGIPESSGKFYIWAEQESAVKIPESRGKWTEVRPASPDGTVPAEYRWVYEIELTALTDYPFPIEGVTAETSTRLILSPVDHYVYNVAGTELQDYLTVPVDCTVPPPPYVSVTVEGARSVTTTPALGAKYNTSENVTTVQVKLMGTLPDHDVTVTLKPSIPSKPGKAWTDYIGLSEYNEGGAHDGATTVTFTKAEIEAGITSKTRYLYALGSDADTVGQDPSKAIRLDSEVDEASRPFYTGAFEYATVFLLRTNPVITQPEFGEEFPDIQGGTTYNFKLKVDDTYKNASAAAPGAGYVIYAKTGNTGSTEKKVDCPTTADKTWHLDAEGALVENDGFLPIAYDTAGTYYTEIRLVAPDGQKSKYVGGTDVAPVKVKVTVSPPKTVEAVVTAKTWKEGSIVPVNFKIGPTAHSETIYAFLKPKTDAMAALVDGTLVIKNGQASDGVEIAQGDTESLDPRVLRLLDGKSPDLMGTSLQFDIVLWKNSEYDETETEYAVEGFSVAKKLQLTVNNEPPKVTKVERTGGGSVTWKSPSDTPSMNVTVAKGVPQKFTLADMSKNEPGVLDLPTMNMKWKFEEYNEAGSFLLGGEQELEGTPALTPWEHTFKTAGYTLVTVQLRDKDMKEYPGEYGDEYTFRVTVTGDPSITVVENGLTFNEADSTGRITVRMSASANDPIDVKVVVTPYEASADPGRFLLDQTKLIDPAVKNEYKLTFTPGTSTAMENFLTFSDLDGTLGSQQKGFRIALTVLTTTLNPDGKQYNEYYHTEDARVFVVNEKPSVIAPASNGPLKDNDKGYMAQIGANESRAITFTVANDVNADVEAGFTVTFICTGGSGTLDGAPYTGPVRVTDLGSHTFVPNFTSQGAQQITLRIEDKDTNAGTEVFERTWYYDVQAAKTLRLVPHGPTGGFTTSAQSQRYADYAAEGHVWADKPNPSMTGFNLSYNCGTAKSVDIYAYGYKVGQPVDDGTLDGGRDVAIGANGDSTEIGPYFTYVSADGKDSFFYRWILIQGGGEDASVGSIAPEHPTSSATAQGSVTLPAELGDDGAYDETVVEAVFGYEYLWSDNMGDINQDGIPDVYITKAWADSFGGIFDPTTGEITGNDLSKLSGFNGDEDFLPSTETSAYGAIIPQLPEKWTTLGTPFDAKTEIRGYHEGLNDAAAQAGITGVKPERIYEVDDGTGTMVYDPTRCTISKLEYLAWKKSGLPADQWSPERPTDPTTADTDEDGFSDGYEYYFWYRAHVGYLENEGTPNERHRYLTGRRYVPTKPGEPETITSAEIAALMDPLVSSGDASGAETRDSDNDGLPDLLEFDMGTNPFDFDTDGDGLPDGYEVMLGKENGFDPLLWSTAKNAKSDADLNADGDAMAEFFDKEMTTVGVVAKDGSVVRYTAKEAFETALGETAAGTGTVIRIINETGTRTNLYLTTSAVTTNVLDGKVILTCDLGKEDAWSAREKDGKTVRGAPVRLIRGTEITDTAEEQEFFDEIVTAVPDLYWSTWVYGVGGGLALGKENLHHDGLKPDETILSNRVAEAVKDKQTIRFVHYHVYQQLGFDPRTAWKRPPDNTQCINTRLFTALDEFLLMAFFHQDGVVDASEFIPTLTNPLTDIWPLYCTDPLKADTDDDGMPDGWEAYVFAGPKVYDTKKESPTYKDRVYGYGPRTMYSPLMPFGEIANATDRDNDTDKLEWPNEFSGSASSAEYADICATIVNLKPEWRNKRWPTDPWNGDTDGDGLKDGEEGTYFIYGDPEATGKAGGGLDPLSWDTDADFLPDPWEVEFAGTAKTTPGSTTATVGANGETNITTTAARADWNMDGMDGTVDDARLDYDNDGLCNWQEYMTGAVRAWRYDDTVSPWDNLVTETALGALVTPDPGDAEAWGKFWGDRLLNPLSPDFNPHLVNGRFDGVQAYFSTPTNVFEQAKVKGFVYMFKDGIYHDLQFPTDPRYKVMDKQYNRFTYKPAMGMPNYAIERKDKKPIYPTKYICCDPRNPDSDFDGMDDYYEMFHGLNPLLGERGTDKVSPVPPLDIIYWSYGGDKEAPWSAGNNYWTDTLKPRVKMEGNIADFEAFPWLAGEAKADPDGDGIRNQLEAIMPNVQAASTHLHTDPTPLWMTDTDYALSIPRRYYLPGVTAVMMPFPGNGNSFVYEGVEHKFTEFPWFSYDKTTDSVTIEYDFNKDHFGVAGYHFSFEENEGYDSDHDYLADFEESQGKTKQASDPQDHDDPLRRQAMWFNGTDAFLQTPLPAAETVAVPAAGGEPRENFLFYTVECWAKADAASLAADNVTRVLVERAIVVGESNAGDEQYLRKNFQLGVRNGLWYTKYDAASTGLKDFEEITDGPAATTDWTHLAATYDGHELRLYVNGICSNAKRTEVQPEHGSLAIRVNEAGEITPGQLDYTTISILVGAGARTTQGVTFDALYRGLSMVPTTIADYTGFFKGYVDEVSLWDGARPASDIRNDYEKRVRLTRDLALENRQVVYANWLNGARRTPVSETQLPPQLMYHWAFDHVAGAIRPEDVMRVPAGFDSAWNVIDAKAIWSRPEGWYSRWRRDGIHASIKSTVFTDDSWIPWINDTVAHLPRLDMTTLDSVYWSEDFAGAVPADAFGYQKFAFARRAEVYSKWTQQTYDADHQAYSLTQRTRWDVANSVSNDTSLAEAYRFTLRDNDRTGFDLLPFGGAYPRRISESEGGMWDDQGAADAWAENGKDSDNNALPDWWEEYARNNYCQDLDPELPLEWDTPVNYHGVTLRAWQAYLRDLAKGMIRDGNRVVINPDYADTRDVDKDGLPDWWEELYDVQGYSADDADADPDNDGLSNYAEYLLGEVYPFDETIGPQLNLESLRLLNPKLSHSITNQLVTDYFLRYATEFKDVKNAAGKSAFYLNEYFGEIVTDHDFMEDWWENAYASSYVSSKVYDPLDDKDEDGWSNWAECRATLWGGHFDASLIDRWTGSDSSQHVACYPEPIVGVRATYNGKQEVSGSALVIRMTTGQTPRMDATFVIPSTLDSQTRYIGPFSADFALHGHMSPGHINGNSIAFERAKVSSDKTYNWNWAWYDENDETHPLQTSGTFTEYRNFYYRYPHIELEGGDLTWEPFTESYERGGSSADIYGTGVKLGTANLTTGEYELDMSKFEGEVSDYVFRVTYTSRIGYEWPQTVYVSDTKELATGAGTGIAGQGRVREGRNTIEAFLDLNGSGTFDEGEPFGTARNVQVGWHKVPEVVIELKDESPIMTAIAVAAADKSGGSETSLTIAANEDGSITMTEKTAAETATAALTKTVRVVRESINGQNVFDGLRLKERTLVTKEIVLDDHPYITEADVATSAKPDLDWTWLLKDAAKVGLLASDIKFAGYRVDEVVKLDDGTVTNKLITTFSKDFPGARPAATAVEPIDSAPVYSASPTLSFSISDTAATGYRLQIRKRGATEPVYDSGVTILPGRTGSTVGAPVCAVTPPVYAGAPVTAGITTNRAVFADSVAYQWRVALYDAKYNATTDDTDASAEWSKWANFEMDVQNENRYPKLPTGYGNATVTVRYYGPNTADLTGTVVVEAFESADFRGQPLAQLRLTDLAELASTADITTPNAVLRGLKPGRVFLRAYIDQNDNGSRDKWESWGYANMVGQGFHAIYNPDPMDITVSTADWVVGKKADRVIYIEDCDVNKNEIPDCLEPELFPATGGDDQDVDDVTDPTLDTDGDGMPDVWENWNDGFTDPTIPDADAVEPGDVMACIDETRYLITFEDGTKLLLASGETYRPEQNKLANAYKYDSWYRYGGDDSEVYGVGTNVTITSATLEIAKAEPVTARLVHAQVYARKGYDMKTANPAAYAAGTSVDTKPFTALDKLMVLRYLQAIGATPENPNPEKYKDFEEYVRLSGSAVWSQWTLMPGEVDYNCDKIADGWQLYVMFGDALRAVGASPTGFVPPVTPWGAIGATRQVTPGNEGLTWAQEYDNGRYPTDPWNPATIGDRYTIDGVEYVISDKDAYAYHLKHFPGEEGDKYGDFDNDGLCNYDEFDIMKNANRTLDADKMFSYFGFVTIPSLTGQCVPDYFLKSTKRNPKIYEQFETNVYDYLGFDYTSHDFIESWWKDQYDSQYVDRTRFEPYDDPDGDGWDNWSEARAGTDPSRTVKLSIENATIAEYPIPLVVVQLPYAAGTTTSNAQIVIAASRAGTVGEYDAVWRMNAGNAAGGVAADNINEKIIGSWQSTKRTMILSPSSIKPGSVFVYAKDLGFTYYDSEWSDDLYYDDLYSQYYGINANTRWSPGDPTEAKWVNVVHDVMRTGDDLVGDLVFTDNNGVTHVVGEVNYETGVLELDFRGITGTKTQIEKILQTSASTTENGNTTSTIMAADSYYHYTRMSLENSYYKIAYSSQYVAQDGNQRFYLSEASAGHIREGMNAFIAFADLDGNGVYDPGEPFGCAKDVQVGWDRVVDLSINLATTSPVIPRFDPMNIGEGISTNEAGTIEYRGKPVVSDLADYQTVRIVRWEINGDECTHRTVFRKTAEQLGVITEADILSDYSFDLDWNYLEKDAAKAGIGLEDIRTVTYAVFVDVGELSPVSEDNVTGWIVKDFSAIRGKATPVAPSKGATAIVTATRPTFEFRAPSGYPAFAFELCDKDGNVVFESTEHIGAKNAAGNVTYRPPVYFGWDEEADTTNRLLPNGEYTWRVAMLSAKYRSAPRGEGAAGTVWSDRAKFTVELAKGKVHDTDKGALDVVVRYYGDATVDAEHPIIVQAFRTADFTGIPEGQTVITNADLLSSYDNITNVNAKIYGLAAGDYYICAFIDTTNDVKRMRWESWGYVNNVGTDRIDLYTPVATKVMRNDTSAAVLFIEDMDCNNDEIPDWMDPTDIPWVWPWPEPPRYEEPPVQVKPEDPEDPHGDDPGGPIPQWFPDVETDPNDVMAYEDLDHVLLVKVALSDADTSARWYAVMDLSNEGWKLRDSDIPLQTLSADLHSLVSTWKMGRFTSIGTNVTFTGDEKVLDTKFSDIRLVHAQVYAKNGYETGCAAVDGISAAEHPHTKPFTRADKYYFCRYLENIGVEGVSEAKMVSEVEKALKGVDPADYETVARPIWSKYTLDPDEIDMDRDDIADGWEAYVMFGTTGLKAFTEGKGIGTLAEAKVSPFNTADGMLVAPGAGSQLKLVEEFDGGYLPTDPWNLDTDGDAVIDYYAYQYHLKGQDAGEDLDGDGLSNYAEYLISEVFRYAKLDPEKKMTDGACVDYFRKMGDLYVGEIFTDHDQVDDVWEGAYGTDYANRDLYDPERDGDKDGWSNYAEFRAGTDPTTGDAYGVDEYTRAEYPVPVIEAKVVYNGNEVNLGKIVFKAWNEETDPKMTDAPDAIWTVGNGEASEKKTEGTGASGSTLQDMDPKYIGRKPSGVQRYALGGGTVAGGTIRLEFMNKQFTDVSYPTNGTEKVSGKPTEKPGDPKNAQWYLAARDDGNGHVVTLTGETIGTVDYAHGILEIDFDSEAICGPTAGDRTTGYAYATEYTATAGNTGYDAFSFDDAHVLVSWQAKLVGLSADGLYTLGDADAVTPTAKSKGHVCEGLTTFICYMADDSGAYVPGAPFGVVRGVDVGWQGAAFTVELTKANPIFARVNLYDGTSDRLTYWGADSGDSAGETFTNFWQDAVWGNAENDYEHVRVVPYAVVGETTETAYYDDAREFVQLCSLVENRVAAEFDVSREPKPFLSEADILRAGEFDLDWNGFSKYINVPKVTDAVGNITAIKYRLVFGSDGPVGYESNLAKGISPIRAFPYLIERRFDLSWTAPRCEGVIGGGGLDPAGVVYTAHPTFVWSMPNEGQSARAKHFGTTYTAFRIRIFEDKEEIYNSGIVRAPAQDDLGRFAWTAPISVGDQTPQGKIFKNSTAFSWKVVMYNAKFQPGGSEPFGSGVFSTSVNTQSPQNDAGFSSIGVTVKYTGPGAVLDGCESVTAPTKSRYGATISATKGMVRVQAFETADFSGAPAAETYIANKTALTDTTDVLTNACLTGLAAGTYYIRAYIDMNGNFEKDDFESWGYAKEPVTVGTKVERMPAVGLYIEDADTNGNWYPDAWEYAHKDIGNWSHDWVDISGSKAVQLNPDGKIAIANAIYDQMVNGLAGVSTGLSGTKITIFQDSKYADLFLNPYVTGWDDSMTTFDAIRKAVEKKVVDKTLKITAITLDTAKSQVILAMDAEVDYANLVAGNFATRLYDLDAMGIDATCTVTVQVWKKSTLAQESWELAGEFEKTFGRGETEVEVPVKDNGSDIDPTSGFYMIKVVQ